MKAYIEKGTACGQVRLPGSKSIAHRMMICAALAEGDTVLENFPGNEDTSATADCLRALGVNIEISGGTAHIHGTGGDFRAMKSPCILPCRESGSTLRFLLPLVMATDRECTFIGAERLFQRPLSVYRDICLENGGTWIQTGTGLTVKGGLHPGEFGFPGNISSQFVTGLLLALPLLRTESSIHLTTECESASYVGLTLDAMRDFGFSAEVRDSETFIIPGCQKGKSPGKCYIPADESGAAFFDALNSVGGKVKICGTDENSRQGDRVRREYTEALINRMATLSLRDCPDLGPVLMVVAAAHHGGVFTDTQRLKLKESDRGQTMAVELAKFGVKTRVSDNSITVDGGGLRKPELPLCGHNDHRIVMSLAVASTVTGGEITDAEAVRKSLPEFWQMLRELGIKVTEEKD